MGGTATTGRRTRRAGGITLLIGAVLFALVVAVTSLPVRAAATTYYVGNTSGRPVTGTDDTNCADAANTTCTLRGALSLVAGGETVRFSSAIPAAPTQTTITLTDGGGGTIALPSVSLDGTGKRVAISGGNSVRVFLITNPVTATLTALTITGGNGDLGGGINNVGGTVTLTGVTMSGNAASLGGGGIHSIGISVGGGGYG